MNKVNRPARPQREDTIPLRRKELTPSGDSSGRAKPLVFQRNAPAAGTPIKPFPRPQPAPPKVAVRPPLRPPVIAGKPLVLRGVPAPAPKGLPNFISKRYDLVCPLGSGGMGAVYKATDKFLNATVALKFLPRTLTMNAAAVESFKNEAKLAMQLSHTNIVRLYHFDAERGRMFLVMEYVDGQDFGKIIDENAPLAMETVLQVAHSCTSALDYAHGCGVIHRDLKPQNLMLTHDGVLKIVDFGIARGAGKMKLKTDAEFVECTPTYTSPEQFRDELPSAATDIYALGAILFEMLAGKPIYPFDVSHKTIQTTPPDLKSDFVQPPVLQVIAKALASQPQARWASAGIFYQKLAEAAAQAAANTSPQG